MESTNPKSVFGQQDLHNLLRIYLPTNSNCSNQCSICNIELTNADKELTATDKDKQLLLFKFYQAFNLEFLHQQGEVIQYCESCNNQLIRIQELELKVQELNQLIEELQDNLMTVLVKSRVDKDSVVVEEGGYGVKCVTDACITQFIKDRRTSCQNSQRQQELPAENQAHQSKIKGEEGRHKFRTQAPTVLFQPPLPASNLREHGKTESLEQLNILNDVQKEDLLYPDVELEIKLEPVDIEMALVLDYNDLDQPASDSIRSQSQSLLSRKNGGDQESQSFPQLDPTEKPRNSRKGRMWTQQSIKFTQSQTPRSNSVWKKAMRRFTSQQPPKAQLQSKAVRKRQKSFNNTEPKTFGCIYGCGREFRTKIGQKKHHYTDHKEIHLKLNPFCCELCLESFGTEEILGGHECQYQKPPLPKKGSRQRRIFTCDVCGKVYTSSENFTNHLYEHEPSKEGFPCEICGVLFDKPLQAKAHLDYAHGKGKDSRNRCCPFCGKQVSCARSYRLHLYKQHKEEYLKDKPFYCKLCYHAFKTQEELDTDFQRHSKCQFCDNRFNDKRKLSEHENTHTGLQPNQCTVCGKRFNKLTNLSTHMMIHTGERPYHCDICPENIGFFRKRELDKHNQKCHALQVL